MSEERKVEAIVAFSGAVEAVDKKDTSAAKRQIAVAKAIDPANAAVAAYAAKLAGGSPRFLIELEKQAPTYNPASLGFLEKGAAYFWMSMSAPNETGFQGGFPTNDSRYEVKETQSAQHPGLLLPLGDKAGLMVDLTFSQYLNFLQDASGSHTPLISGESRGGPNLDFWLFGGTVGYGRRLADSLSFGAACNIAVLSGDSSSSTTVFGYDYMKARGFCPGATLGLAYKSPSGALTADAQLVWSSEPELYYDPPPKPAVTGSLVKGKVPLLGSLGATVGLLDKRIFLSGKVIGEYYIDERSGYTLRAIPGLEVWPLRALALRGAYEYSMLDIDGATDSGSGYMAGASLVLGAFDLNFNWINRLRPNRILPGTDRHTNSFMVGLVWSGLRSR